MSITAVGQTANGRDCITAGGNRSAPSPGAVEAKRIGCAAYAVGAKRRAAFRLAEVCVQVYIWVHKEMAPHDAAYDL